MTPVPTPQPTELAVVEQLLRWQLLDEHAQAQHRTPADEAAPVAAATGTREQFAKTVAELARSYGPETSPYLMDKALHGDPVSLTAALHGHGDLQALHRTVVQRAGGVDVAEVATSNGLRLRAEATGDTYQTAVLIEDEPGRSDVLASGSITATSAIEALKTAAEREHAVQGLDQTDLRLVTQQIARLERLTSNQLTGPAYPHPQTSTSTATIAPSAGTISETHDQLDIANVITGRNLEHDPGVVILATTLQNAANAGWDLSQHLPTVMALGPLNETHPAHDLAYRVMDACPDAIPPPPTVTEINGSGKRSRDRARRAAEQPITRPPAPDHGHTIGR